MIISFDVAYPFWHGKLVLFFPKGVLLLAAQVPSWGRLICVLVNITCTRLWARWLSRTVHSYHPSRVENLIEEGGGQGRAASVHGCFYLVGLRSSIRESTTRNKPFTRWLGMLGHMFRQHPSFTLLFWLLQKLMLLRQSSSDFKVMTLLCIENLPFVGCRFYIKTGFWIFKQNSN